MSVTVRRLRYSRPALRRDYARGSAGVAMCVLLVFLSIPFGLGFWLFAGLGVLFVGFILYTAIKHASCIEIDAGLVRRVVVVPVLGAMRARTIELSGLTAFRLRYFGGRRDRGKGIVELSLRAGGASLTVDQGLEHFDDLVLLVSEAAERAGIEPDPATSANLARMGFK